MGSVEAKHRTDSIYAQLCRYSIVGGIAFAVDFSLLFLLTRYWGIHYLISAGAAFIAGLVVNYALSIKWVFYKRTIGNKSMEFLIFALIGLIGLGLNEFFIWFFTDLVHFHYLLSKVASTVFVYLWNFCARKYTLFR